MRAGVARSFGMSRSASSWFTMVAPSQMFGSSGKLKGEVDKLDADKFAKFIEGMYAALQAAQVVATVPQAAPVADVIAQGAGYKPQGGTDPGLPQPAAPVAPQQVVAGTDAPNSGMPPLNPPSGAAGARTGIETARADGVVQ